MQHLLHKSQFDAVLGTRSDLTRTTRTEHFFAHRLAFSETTAHLFGKQNDIFIGVMAAKRFAKRAVTRNLIKRQVYALAQEIPLTPAAYVIRLRAGFPKSAFPSASSVPLKRLIRAELTALLSNHLTPPRPAAT